MAPEFSELEPLAVVLLRRGTVGMRALRAIEDDPRIELFQVRQLTPDRRAFAQRVAAVLVATNRDPLAALTYVVTAGVTAPIVVAMTAAYRREKRDVLAAGARACVILPVKPADVDRLIEELRGQAPPARVDSTLRLLLDPIGRVVRYQDRSMRLSQREFALLHRLSAGHGRPVAADEILTYVWGDRKGSRSRQILEVYIFQLRRKLNRLGLRGAIATVRGFGYALSQVADKSR
ncbi:MAG TPA: winged helix-turn-helix domain-containing protein [Gemmatimonadaceae bacterium]|nr:winged helix-turn-helix domain-containing protein [Gemmatimonadaceae bacterium]